jgi:hypothetical protein
MSDRNLTPTKCDWQELAAAHYGLSVHCTTSQKMSAVVTIENRNRPKKELSPHAERARLQISEAGRLIHDARSLSVGRGYVGAVRLESEGIFVAAGFALRSAAVPPPAAAFSLQDAQLSAGAPSEPIVFVAPIVAALFRKRPELQSVIYTQSPNLTAFAVARRPLPVVYGFSLLRKTPDDLPVTRGQQRLDQHAVLEALERNPCSPAVLLANRGVVVFGRENPLALARVLVSLEESAGIIINATALGGAQPFPPGAHHAVQQGGAFE